MAKVGKRTALAVALLVLAAGCQTRVTHPERSAEQMRADVARCSDQANRRYWMDPLAALYNAYDCLEALGYQRQRSGLQAMIDEHLAGSRGPATPPEPRTPCRVPCTRGN